MVVKGLTDLSVVMVMTGGATGLAVMEWSGGVFLVYGLLFFPPQLSGCPATSLLLIA